MQDTPASSPSGGPKSGAGPAAVAPRSAWRWLWRGLLALLVLAALLMGLLAWLSSGSGLRWLSEQPLQFGSTHVELQDVRGSVWSELRIARLQVQSPKADVDARDLHLRWNPRALLRSSKRVEIQQLSFARLDVTLPPRPSPGPLALPQSLTLPVELRVAQLDIGQLRVGAPGALQDFGALRATFDADGGAARVQVHAMASWGQAQAAITLGLRRPFSVGGALLATLRLHKDTLSLAAQSSGSLQALRLQGTASARHTQARFDAHLAPFSTLPLRSARVRATDVDPARLAPGLPAAAIDAQLDLQPSNAQDVRGSLRLQNARPGPVNAGLVPLRSVQAALRLQRGSLRVDQLRAVLTGDAELTGRANWQEEALPRSTAAQAHGQPGGAFTVDLQATQVNLHALDGRLLATRLSGPLQASGTLQSQDLQLRLEQPGWLAELRATHAGERIAITRMRLQAQGGRLDATGVVSTGPPQHFDLTGTLDHFDPSRFGAYPVADLNLHVHLQGDARARSAQVALQVYPSRWRGHVFSGQARGMASPAGVRGLQAAVLLGRNRLDAQGDFGRAGDTLRWRLDAPELAQIGPGFDGQVQGSGTLSGTLAQPSGRFDLHGSRLVVPGAMRVDALDARGSLSAGLQGPMSLQIDGRGIRAGTLALQQVQVQAGGRLDAQRITLRLRGTDLDLSTRLDGGYTPAQGWHGSVEQLTNTGRYALHLLAPAQLALAPGLVEVQHARVQSAGGLLDLREATWKAGSIATSGGASGVDPAYWLRLAGVDLQGVRSTLRLGVEWAITMGQTVSGHVDIVRTAGDVNLPTDSRLSLGLSTLDLHVLARDNAVSVSVDAAGSLLGTVHGTVQSRIARRGAAWGFEGTAPLAGSLRADLPSLAWAGVLLGPTARVGGSLLLDMHAAGTVGDPQLSGLLNGKGLALSLPEQGLDLHGGVLDASFSGDRLQLMRLSVQGGQGNLTASGSAQFAGGKPTAAFAFTAHALRILNRPDRQAVVSGNGTLTLGGRSAHLDGRLAVDSATIELPRGSAPKLANDVVIKGRAQSTAAKPRGLGYAVTAVVQVDLGRKVHVSGYGLDADLGGQLALRAASGEPLAASGSIEVRKGTYSAYGQTLALVKGGAVNFSGPIDNPGLNFAAQRSGLPVVVGVQVTGTLRAPQVALTSTPAMPDSEILSWLVLGQDLSTASPNNLALLQTAAGALLASGQGAPVTSRVASALGLSQLSLAGQGGLQNSIVTLGKRITSKLSIGVEQGLGTTGSLFNIRYDFTHRLSLRLQSGADSAVDVFYTFRFD
ncbi:MAG: hypothetical protein HIU89_11485 [Proteobacteria bacterium]|nr:hypothetical protein [Pseudomonadota bacterium]